MPASQIQNCEQQHAGNKYKNRYDFVGSALIFKNSVSENKKNAGEQVQKQGSPASHARFIPNAVF